MSDILRCLSATDCHPYPRRERWWHRLPRQVTHGCQLRRGHTGYHYAEFASDLGIGYVVKWDDDTTKRIVGVS